MKKTRVAGYIISIFLLAAFRAETARAQEPLAQRSGAAGESKPAAPAMPRLVPQQDYRGDLWNRPALTGDWGGLRQKWMDKGVRIDLSTTQTLQGNVNGGRQDEFTYASRTNLRLRVDTGYAGLWPGGILTVRAEGRYGPDNNANTGALYPVNTDAIFPASRDEVALSELNYTQFLASWLGVTFGKMSPRETNVFASDEREQFLNAAFNFHFAPETTIPLGFLGAGLILVPTNWLTVTTLALDSEGKITTSGFSTAFERGTTVAQFWEAKIEPFGLPGSQRFGWSWSDRIKVQFQQNALAIIGAILTGADPPIERVGNDRSFFYDFDQYLYLVPGTKDRGIGIFGRFGWGDSDVNPIANYFSFGIGGKGIIPGRERDGFGIGYYHTYLSDELPRALKNRSRDVEQGAEIYYNFAVTPWLQLTPDLQIIRPASNRVGTTVVGALRVKVEF